MGEVGCGFGLAVWLSGLGGVELDGVGILSVRGSAGFPAGVFAGRAAVGGGVGRSVEAATRPGLFGCAVCAGVVAGSVVGAAERGESAGGAAGAKVGGAVAVAAEAAVVDVFAGADGGSVEPPVFAWPGVWLGADGGVFGAVGADGAPDAFGAEGTPADGGAAAVV
ncbi:hypothetical protein [Nocardia cyriacigeorgica]|uniref:hypothetical protein n=1 Tax=Nocardia cyriacigeorgica TaxID=135487 RepID=UPI001895975E|nr:hypothetical protein [Nocardia cyriacigeorgica]MBF6481326.1 hypothetical protein [Nocardia cyriacigeorgica]